MYKVWLYLLFLALAATQVLAQGCGPQNPNCIVPTRPPGDSTNAAASTAFVTNATSNGQVSILTSNNTWTGTNTFTNTTSMTGTLSVSGLAYFTNTTSLAGKVYNVSGIPYLDLQGCAGATADAVTDWSTPMQNCINAFESAFSNGTIWLNQSSGGIFCVTEGLTLHNTGITLQGAGRESAVLGACGHDTTVLTLLAGSSVTDLALWGAGYSTAVNVFSGGSTHYTLNCVSCQRLVNLQIRGGNGSLDQEQDIHIVNNVDASLSYGTAVWTWQGGCWAYGNKFDQDAPKGTPAYPYTFSVWQSSHTYSTGDIYILPASSVFAQVTSGGVSGTTTPSANNYTVVAADGGTLYALAAPELLDGARFDTGASECAVSQTDHTGIYNHSINFTNTLAGNPPRFINLTDIAATAGVNSTINIANGHDIWIQGSHLGGCAATGCVGIFISSNFTSNARVTDTRFITPGLAGLSANVGSGMILANSHEEDAATNSIIVGGTASSYNIHDNNFIHPCVISNSGPGFVHDNVGCNSDFAAPLPISGSPMTYTTSVKSETINVTATTSIGSIVINGADILNGALGANVHYPFFVGPNVAVTITYTGTLSGSHITH